MQEISRKLKQAKFPVIAAIHGYALGAGSEFALSCDLVYAGADTKIGFPEVGVGLSIGCGITHLLPKTVGLMKAKELVFLGELIGAQEAKNLGLINDVVPNERLAEKVDAVAYRLIEQPQLALEKAKIALNQGIQSDIESAYDLETEHAVALRAHPDAKEKAESFRER